jgi:hypothetical protein
LPLIAEFISITAKIIMAQPSPLSALCTANEVAVAIEAGPARSPGQPPKRKNQRAFYTVKSFTNMTMGEL